MILDTAKLKVSTKTMATALFAFGAFMQIPQVNAFVLQLTAQHKNLAPIVGALSGLAVLLHNPEVQVALGIKKTVEVKENTEEVSLTGDGQ